MTSSNIVPLNPTHSDLEDKIDQYRKVTAQIKELEIKKAELHEAITMSHNGEEFMEYGVQIIRVERAPSTDYRAAFESLQPSLKRRVDLTQFTRTTKPYYQIKAVL